MLGQQEGETANTADLELLLLTFNTQFDYSLEGVFDTQLSSVLVMFLTTEEIFLKLALLNKSFYQIANQMKNYKHIWVHKFVHEFTSNDGLKQLHSDIELIADPDHAKIYLEDHYLEYLQIFADLKSEKADEKTAQTEFEMFKRVHSMQGRIRRLLIQLFDMTKDQRMLSGKNLKD